MQKKAHSWDLHPRGRHLKGREGTFWQTLLLRSKPAKPWTGHPSAGSWEERSEPAGCWENRWDRSRCWRSRDTPLTKGAGMLSCKKRGRGSSALATAASPCSPVQGRRTPWPILTPPHSLGQGPGRPQPQKQLFLAMQRHPRGLGHDPGGAAAVIVRALSSCALRTPTPSEPWLGLLSALPTPPHRLLLHLGQTGPGWRVRQGQSEGSEAWLVV